MDIGEYDAGEHVKEVFAYFGRAYYMSNVFEQGLALAVLHLDFLAGVKGQIEQVGTKSFDRTRYEAEFDAFMKRHEAMTLGNLIRRFMTVGSPDDLLSEQIALAKQRRDLLAHHYFRERSVEFAKRRGRDQMIEELNEASELFTVVDRALNRFMEPVHARLGIRKEALAAYVEQYYESVIAED